VCRLPSVAISHSRTPNDQTSLCDVKTRSRIDSSAIHLSGRRPFVSLQYWSPASTSRARPKSHSFTTLSAPTSTLRAARSRCTYFLSVRYSCVAAAHNQLGSSSRRHYQIRQIINSRKKSDALFSEVIDANGRTVRSIVVVANV